ncbi:MAG: S49 family peptidase [Rickettsiaceae bacterium]|nr:S49 family peptidase [Rickettsiaceae bacterium]
MTKRNKPASQTNNSVSSGSVLSNRVQSKLNSVLSCLPFGCGSDKPVVAVLRLDGVIGKGGALKSGLSISSLNKMIESMFNINHLDAVCLNINSPGGSPVQSELIASRIIGLSKEKDIPVFSFVEDVAASGGYWLACAGEKIYASQSSIVGSIGVISSGFGFHQAMEKLGVERRVYTEGLSKSVLDPFLPAKQEDIKIINKIQKDVHQHFINTVKKRRAGKLTQNDELLFNGEFWTGQTAVDFGLVDGIDDLYSFIQKRYGDDVKIEYIENKPSWFKKKLGVDSVSKEFAADFSESLVDSLESRLISSRFGIK